MTGKHSAYFFIVLFLFNFLSAERIRVASFNVQNYLVTDRWHDGVYKTEYPKPENEKTALRRIIKEVSPDVLAIQEMGDQRYLDELQRDLEAEGLSYEYQLLMLGYDTERHTALLSKIPYDEAKLNSQLRFKYYGEGRSVLRGLMEVSFSTKGSRWTLFNIHLKSRRSIRKDDSKSSKFRSGEARVIAKYVADKYDHENDYLIMLGDFNDHPKSTCLKNFLKKSSKTFFVDIPAYDSRGEQWTYNYRSRRLYEQVDYILSSEKLKSKIVSGKVFIADGADSLVASDHRMLYVDLEF